MTKNRDIAEIMFSAMRKIGLTPYDIRYGNGYFISERGDDSVIHFKLRGVWKHWQFGMWVNSEYLEDKYRARERNLTYDQLYKVVQIFSQYDTQIDKFKPSTSALCVEYNACEWDKHIDGTYLYPWHELESMLKMIKRHPFICYAEFCGKCANYYNKSFFINFSKNEGKIKVQKVQEAIQTGFWLLYTKVKLLFAKKDKCIDGIMLYDFEKENQGWSTSHKFEIQVVFKESITDDEMCRWLNFWFRKDEYGKYGIYNWVVKLGRLHQVGVDSPFSFYIKP